MNIKVLIVDDSHFFRRCIGDIISKADGLEVIDFAINGQEAVDKALALNPDVVLMDVEMPVKNGIDATREIMSKRPMPILMFSSLTHKGAQATLDALDAGAADFITKKFEEIVGSGKVASERIVVAIKELCRRPNRHRVRQSALAPLAKPPTINYDPRRTRQSERTAQQPIVKPTTLQRAKPIINAPINKASGKKYSLLAIASSTGGPVALQKLLTKLPVNFPYPILIVQHMPAAFTGAFAERLNVLCKIGVKEAKNGDIIRPGQAYLAPGGKQMLLDRANRLKIGPGPEHLNYKPCADITFASISKNHDGNTLAVILTGMGSDGCDGAKLLSSNGASIWTQDEATSVVYGMPKSVKKANLSDKELPIDVIGESIIKEMSYG